jgi:uncharacterized protein (DUF2342 family)
MRDLSEILELVEKTNDKYRTTGVSFTQTQTEMLRDYDVCFFDLTEHRIFYHNEWLDAYNETKGSNAAKERTADIKVRELYLIRHTMTAIKTKIDVLRSNISANKKQ